MKETFNRSLIKTISWRLIVLVIDFSIAYLFTQNFDLSSKLAIAKLIAASLFYLIHERIWNKINWGKT
jgi:uncharacterized membrane protein